ncbi:MAG: hypothetical protein ACJ74Q_08080 [Pyrinomonadaceae bacterium]
MRTIYKEYNSAFIVEKSKVNRLIGIVQEKLNEFGLQTSEQFEAHLSGHKTFETNSLAEIFELDNSHRNRIKQLTVKCAVNALGATIPEHQVRIDFDGELPTDISITIESQNTKWAMDTMSVAEEQVERTLQRGFMYKIRRLDIPILIALLAVLFSIGLPLVLSLFSRSGDSTEQPLTTSSPMNTMWLTESDLKELEAKLRDNQALTNDQAADVLTRQLKNILAEQKSKEQKARLSSASVFRDWRLLLLISPIIIILIAFIYLTRCYPPAVFLWGDAEEWYQILVNRRRNIWSLIIGAMLIGIISNLFVFGLSGFVHP